MITNQVVLPAAVTPLCSGRVIVSFVGSRAVALFSVGFHPARVLFGDAVALAAATLARHARESSAREIAFLLEDIRLDSFG
jgi:hypothetical protein